MSQQNYLTLRIYGALILLFGLGYTVPGLILVSAGGAGWFVPTGLLLSLSGLLMLLRRPSFYWAYAGALLLTLIFTWLEKGLTFWALIPRFLLIALLGLPLLLPVFLRSTRSAAGVVAPGMVGLLLVVIAGYTLAAFIRFQNDLTQPLATLRSVSASVQDSEAEPRADWSTYGGSPMGTRFSPATQLTPDNVGDLQLAWTYRTGLGGTFKNTPLMVDDSLYLCGGGNEIISLDAESGQENWRFDAGVSEATKSLIPYFTTTCRGVSYHRAPPEYQGECPERILMGTVDARLLAVDARTGQACTSFGDNGAVDLTAHLGPVSGILYFVTSAPAIVRGRAVVGGWVVDNVSVNEPSGVVRAFDALTGKFSWAWDMGRPGQHGLPADGEVFTRATPNVWSLFSVDEENGLVFAPLGNETPDYFGAHRLDASEQFASSVAAINGETGELVWSFQTVHHDIWDYDVPAQPVLTEVTDQAGNLVPAVVQATKRGEVFLLHRLTGEPVAPVTEKQVPSGGVPEDWTAPTQPYSALPNILRDGLDETDMFGITPFDMLACRIGFRRLRYEGDFTPPTTRGGLQYPGNAGGYNWGSVSVDGQRQVMVGNLMNLANYTRLVPREEMDAGTQGAPQAGTPYGVQTVTFTSPLGIPCNEPPYGYMVAIDLAAQTLLWKRPIGTGHRMIGFPLEVGTPNSGGTMLTISGLIFMGGTMDGRIRAFDLATGEERWQFEMANSGQATPMSYLAPVSGKQTIIMVAPHDAGPRPAVAGEGGYVYAFRLPDA
ncbi:MAG: membrane-bound PQQ-dependent dehydrogenase, glucose/quinate/shikimate family [Pseudomonadales bacterium]|nr:membrane-bound PQQ-dependent dehydrogenase, glucose/quinate/shikimate family [Pseudomonadales bacterium]